MRLVRLLEASDKRKITILLIVILITAGITYLLLLQSLHLPRLLRLVCVATQGVNLFLLGFALGLLLFDRIITRIFFSDGE